MKKILIFLFIIISASSFAQDSARLKINVSIQARDCEIILFFTKTASGQKLEDLDSTLLSIWRPPAINPTGTTQVGINGIETRVWLEIWRMCFDHPIIVIGGTADRIGTVLKASGHSWLVNKITKDENDRNDAWVSFRKIGREYGKKETTGFE